ncbi:MAG: DUF2232 domain-containing protein [Cyanobacteria bacterium J06627_32]
MTPPDLPSPDSPSSTSSTSNGPNNAPGIDDSGHDGPWIPDDDLSDGTMSDTPLSKRPLAPTIKNAVGSKQKHSAELFPIPPEPPLPPSTAQAAGHVPAEGVIGPLPLVETAFLASAASLMWLVNIYFPPGPLLRILFPLPIVLVYLRWNARAAWMAATVSGLLLTILLGPTRSILFVMPYGFLGVQLGCLWRRRASWELSIVTGALLVASGSFFRIWLLSLLAGEDFWGYLIAQITQLIDWAMRVLTNWGWISLGALGQPSMTFVAIAAVLMVIFASVVYLFTVHLAAWLVLERLGVAMPEPPGWVQVLIDE